MRIIGGDLKGRVFKGPVSNAIRPTSDRLRETIFDIVMNGFPEAVTGARILDVFSGTGAIAFEALSRGAAAATLVDDSPKAATLIRENTISLQFETKARLIRRDARKLGASNGDVHDFAFLDPPYGKALPVPVLNVLRDGAWLKPNAMVVIEDAAGAETGLPEGFCHLQSRTYGDTKLVFARFLSR